MPVYYARYELQNGYIHNWLVAGPQATPPDLERYQGQDWKLQIARHYYEAESGVTEAPVQDEAFLPEGPPQGGTDAALKWRYTRCDDDHFVDCTAFYHICHYLRTWAYQPGGEPRGG